MNYITLVASIRGDSCFCDALGHPQRNNSKRVPAWLLSPSNSKTIHRMAKMYVKVIVYEAQSSRRSLASLLKSTTTTLLPLSTRRPQASHRHEDDALEIGTTPVSNRITVMPL